MGATARGTAAIALVSSVLACGGDEGRREAQSDPAGPATDRAADVVETRGRTERAAFVHSAQRCGECHAAAVAEWEASPHARSATSPLLRAALAQTSQQARGECAACHAPLAAWVPADDPIAAEGVACDGCHAIASATVGAREVRFDLRLDDNVKYATLCDAEDHYFHRMGCSELHGRAQLCASCHHLVRDVDGVEVPIYSEYREWSEGPYADEGVDCQQCHMPERTGAIAVGSPERESLSHHGFFGEANDLRTRALDVRVTATGAEDQVALVVELENRRAGHRVPSGMPGRQIVVTARALGTDGVELSRAEHALGRVLVDERGREVLHHEAVRVERDDRIAPRETRRIDLGLASDSAGEVVVDVTWRELRPALAEVLGVSEPRELPLARARLTIGAPAARRRVGRVRLELGGDS